ncbi:DUF721 domain-containing protein [Candidatus Babeliales bacterium]|nr:DUF721 domain-containing protein [Candidatus Babeliales bacterium]MCF7899334.1 DUF721 domain-containing protein [Candidatus Babeliales bacterium]
MAEQITKFLNNFISPEYKWKAKIFENWKTIIGNLNDKAKIERIEKNMLLIGVEHPAWAQELLFLSDFMKKRINNFLGKDYIKEIRFKVINFNKKISHKTNKSEILNKTPDQVHLFLNNFEINTLLTIKDQELKKLLKEFCFRCKLKREGK